MLRAPRAHLDAKGIVHRPNRKNKDVVFDLYQRTAHLRSALRLGDCNSVLISQRTGCGMQEDTVCRCTAKYKHYPHLEAGFSKPNVFGETGNNSAFLWIDFLNDCLKIVGLRTPSMPT